MNDIHDIKPLMPIEFPWWPFLGTLAVMIGVILLGAWLISRLLRRRVKAAVPAPALVSPQTALEQALQALAQLQTASALQQEQAQNVYLELEAILKRFLEALHHKPISGYTDQELAHLLAQLPSLAQLPGVRQALTEMRERSLLARFGRGRISRAQMQQDLEMLRDFVQIAAENQKRQAA